MSFTGVTIAALVFTIDFICCYDNLALNKPTYQSHPYFSENHRTATFDSSNAVDGLKNDLSAFGGQCAISELPPGASNGFTSRFLGFNVYVSNTTNIKDGHLCFHDTNYTKATIPAMVNISCLVHGRYIIYFNKRPQNSSNAEQFYQYAHAELCEVEVYGCNTDFYGPSCSFSCPDNCRFCHIETGACQGCKPGYQGHQCELQCGNRTYGDTCMERCGVCLGYKQCHHINGSCPEGCDAGHKGELCKTDCSSGKFGINCQEDCNEKCAIPYKCNGMSGECVGGCQPGWDGLQCKDVCRENMYGINCAICGFCRYSTCHHVNGSCVGGCAKGYQGNLCNKACKAGFYGDDCRKECSIFCKTSGDCNHVTGHCNEGCIGGWQGVKCLEVSGKSDKWQCSSRFYGVLAALCLSITIIIVLLVSTYINRRKTQGIHENQNLTDDIRITKGKLDLQMISGKTDENESSKYQELGVLSLSSDYDHLP